MRGLDPRIQDDLPLLKSDLLAAPSHGLPVKSGNEGGEVDAPPCAYRALASGTRIIDPVGTVSGLDRVPAAGFAGIGEVAG